jgi:hypothetical protein
MGIEQKKYHNVLTFNFIFNFWYAGLELHFAHYHPQYLGYTYIITMNYGESVMLCPNDLFKDDTGTQHILSGPMIICFF